jgi:hypothetical protein
MNKNIKKDREHEHSSTRQYTVPLIAQAVLEATSDGITEVLLCRQYNVAVQFCGTVNMSTAAPGSTLPGLVLIC